MLSFMDKHPGYNQVPMCREDDEKMTFIEEGTFYFMVDVVDNTSYSLIVRDLGTVR